MKKWRKTIYATICIALTIMSLVPIWAFAEGEHADEENPPVDLTYINYANCTLSINGGTATIGVSVRGVSSVTKITAEIKLQKKVVFWWTSQTWTETVYSNRLDLTKTQSVGTGTYRAIAKITVWSGNNTETTTVTTSEVVY